uniref:Uncharacterized protein n=1 Tax=Octopus bimaculoides TaxID=37653 RepID=A0A0L8HLA6_OCTBM
MNFKTKNSRHVVKLQREKHDNNKYKTVGELMLYLPKRICPSLYTSMHTGTPICFNFNHATAQVWKSMHNYIAVKLRSLNEMFRPIKKNKKKTNYTWQKWRAEEATEEFI